MLTADHDDMTRPHEIDVAADDAACDAHLIEHKPPGGKKTEHGEQLILMIPEPLLDRQTISFPHFLDMVKSAPSRYRIVKLL
jgi:hypothetical protein